MISDLHNAPLEIDACATRVAQGTLESKTAAQQRGAQNGEVDKSAKFSTAQSR